jgi:hypothetical protein
LIALDGLDTGMTRRDIAVLLYGDARVANGWTQGGGSLRDSIKYLVRKAQSLREGGYLIELLGMQAGPGLPAA